MVRMRMKVRVRARVKLGLSIHGNCGVSAELRLNEEESWTGCMLDLQIDGGRLPSWQPVGRSLQLPQPLGLRGLACSD